MVSTGRLDFLRQLYNHVALPRDVPGKEDGNLHHIDTALLNRMMEAVVKITPYCAVDLRSHLEGLYSSLKACQTLNTSGTISKSTLMKQLCALGQYKMLILHLNPQNCGLLIYHQVSSVGESSIVVEAFETSATADKVLAAKSALQWDFPGSAVSISESTFNEPSFQDALATFLEQASTEYITKFAAVTWKAAAKLAEIRDTSDPAVISGLLMAVLEANGTAINVPRLRKRVRDTVTFENARKPWRRSAFYLVLRVATQRYLYQHLGAQEGRKMYKTIMCALHAQLLENALRKIPLEAAFFLRQKLGRRLAKMSSDLHSSSNPPLCTQPFDGMPLERDFEKTLGTTGAYLKQVWRKYQMSQERNVPQLRRSAYDNELRLHLNASGKTLRNISAQDFSFPRRQERTATGILDSYQQSATSTKPYMEAVSGHISSSKYHEDVILSAKRSIQSGGSCVIKLSETVRDYVDVICEGDQTYTYQKSQQLLYLMELWILMDKAAVAGYPLLLDFHPGFCSDVLDPIELLTLEEMGRVHNVRRYLSARCRSPTATQSKTIFDDPSDDCFAVRFYDNEGLEGELLAMREKIEDAAKTACINKEVEWEEKSTKYEKKTLELNEKECVYEPVIDQDLRIAGSRHRVPCEWHKLHHELKNMRIQIFEHPLPSYEPDAKATLFELQCPEEFAAYRDATWLILSSLCHKPVEHLDRISLVREYSQLRPYANKTHCQVTLGSYKKAHLESHYATWGFPIALQEIIRKCGLKPRYYDNAGTFWTDRPKKASFWHHFPVKLPSNSPFSTLGLDYAAWPTSNQIQASQPKCPQGLGIHEFTASQGLLVGTHSRWIGLLRELGSSNINFSSESTWVIVSRLVLQLGPSCNHSWEYTDIHSSLVDKDLSTALLAQIDYRLQGIRRNWREPIQMEILITILLKIISLTGDSKTLIRAMELLHQACKITDGWRRELQTIVTEDSTVLQWIIWASLLCKRTLHTEIQLLADPEHLQTYLDASISLHYNLSVEIGGMPCSLQNAIIRDVLFAYENRDLVRRTLIAHPEVFIASLKAVWHVPGSFECTMSPLETVPGTWWMSLTLKSNAEQDSNFVHFNYLYGTLLIDGKEMGTLPLLYRAHSTFKHIFGTKNPIVYPSPLRGMDFALCEMMPRKHRIHLAYRDGQVIIRADNNGQLLEFIPSEVFRSDLPLPLVEGCYHWLYVHTGQVEIRQKDKWTSKGTNWWLRLYQHGSYCAVRRFQEPSQNILLEPRSPFVQSIAQVFTHFEVPSQILVWVSQDGQVNVDLKRMELSFFINSKGLLESRRLGATISHNQDCGTWYGLRNKIMIQSISNHRQISVLVPLGDFKVFRDGPHVCVDIEMGSGQYLKYLINDTLGRIDCAPEPRMLYTKALLHAYTSYVIADPLTGRTGTEEALRLLHSAAYQPWNPLPTHMIDLLNRIAELSPKRGYYPPESRYMETVRWNADCTIYMQDDGFVAAIARILRKSSDLSQFFLDQEVQERPDLPTEATHLAARALARSTTRKRKTATYQEEVYCTRDTRASSQQLLNVLGISKLLLSWQPTCATDASLVALLHDAPVVGGYDKLYRKCLLSDHFAVDLRAEWGALTQKALQCNWDDKFSLMFLFSVLAFSPDANLDLLRVLVSFAMLPEIRAIPAPKHPAYFHFRADGTPPTSYFVSLMAKARIAFSETGFKKRSQLVKAQSLHEPNVDKACELLATSISAQWPSPTIDPKKLPITNPEYLDVERALADITAEWTRLTQNHELCMYLEQVQKVLSRASLQHGQSLPPVITEIKPSPATIYPQRSRASDDLTLRHLLQFRIPSNTVATTTALPVIESYARALSVRSSNIVHGPENHYIHMNNFKEQKTLHAQISAPQPKEISMLREIVTRFKDPSSFIQCRYAKELEASIHALQKRIMNDKNALSQQYHQIRADEITSAKRSVSAAAEHIRRTLRHSHTQAKWLQMVNLLPSMTFIDLLVELRETSGTAFGEGSKEALVALGLAMTKLQRLLRIADAQKRHKYQQVQDEWTNEGHTNWDPMKHSDWLLLEIDGDVLLREEQIDVALATVSPPSGQNSVLQLLMGKGKTSCILPMAAALLANGTDLARVVVPRALLLQSAQAMQAKLGGLVNRELMHVPFSRKTTPKESLIHLYGKLHTKLRDRRGILLTLPEHILSFKLSGLQQLCDANLEAASKMVDTQRWLDQHARDVLDECDVSLAIRTQLIYPSGTQMTVDGHPMRWQIIQAVLHLVKDFSTTVQSRYPHSIEIVKRSYDGFPLLYFLRKDAEDYLLDLLVTIICKGQTPSILPCAEYHLDMRQDIKAYISVPTVRGHIVSRISDQFQDKPKLMRTINLLRGLFVHRILLTTLKKRWNVQYGLHPVRAPIAVPYLAKGVPSPFADNLNRCVVYLDESHCRGTDLKFPPDARAALTLGQHLTKDALVQAAMRLRLLGQTQSVSFYSPPEVHQGILDRLNKTARGYHPTSGDVLQWVFGQTCDIMEQSEPSFFAQASQYMQQEQARLEYPDYPGDSISRNAFLAKVRIKETLSLKQLYQPKVQRQNGCSKTIKWHPVLEGISTELQRRRKHFQDRGSAVHASTLEEVEIEREREAEREIESEVKHVREVQQSLAYKAAKVKNLHEDVMHFATFGRLVPGSDAYRPMFSQLARTELGLKHTINPSMKSSLWISAQFNHTIETFEPNDNYIRSPHWVLWSAVSEQALLVSPEEADGLIPILRHARLLEAESKIHLIVYAAPVTRRMLHFNQLNYYVTPPLPADFRAPVWLRIELGLFSGRLYLEWDEYHKSLEYLGLCDDLSQHLDKPPFATKPLTFLHEWITLRRKGQDFEHTPMGFITTGKPLTEQHPFFRVLTKEDDVERVQTIARHALGYSEEEHDDDEHDDQGDEDFVPAVEHVDDSEEEDAESESGGDEEFVNAVDGGVEGTRSVRFCLDTVCSVVYSGFGGGGV